jgi:hypothetical protein
MLYKFVNERETADIIIFLKKNKLFLKLCPEGVNVFNFLKENIT